MRHCERCRISYARTYARSRCEECGGVVTSRPGELFPRWVEVRRTESVPDATYGPRVTRSNRRLAQAAAQARVRFLAR